MRLLTAAFLAGRTGWKAWDIDSARCRRLLNSDWKELPIFASASNCELRRAARCGAQIDVGRESRDEILERGMSRGGRKCAAISAAHLEVVASWL